MRPEEEDKSRPIKRMVKYFLKKEGMLMRRTKNGLNSVSWMKEKVAILRTLYDEVGN